MSKRLVVCCDGTWAIADQQSPTNVTKVALAIAPADASGQQQRSYYHPGVGTRRFERFVGGVFGYGLSRNVRDAYRFLVRNFEPGDEIFLFGFSRGAYTARSVAGLIRNAGILRRENEDRLDRAYALYRSRSDATHPRSVAATLFRRSYSHETRIRFIGVWDTVGALGIPVSGIPLVNLINRRFQFHDTNLSTSVDAAFQALAIDEKRGPYRPAIWAPQLDAPPYQRVEQVWFAGAHGNIGGGDRDHRLSDLALLWMADRARDLGLAFDLEAFARAHPRDAASSSEQAPLITATDVDPDALAPMDNTRVGVYRLFPPFVRKIGVTDPAHESVASTAVERRDATAYAPPSLVAYLKGNPKVTTVPAGSSSE